MTPLLQRVITELKARLNGLYGVRLSHLVLFGSQARGDAVVGSDIDVLVVLRDTVNAGKEIERTGGITSSLSLQHDVVISCTFVSEARYETEKSPLLLNIHREGVPV
ncbi:MAG: nucleotidyltransferase domain-containing protein [Nitrospiraceae bacterium]|nr:nucleotidyltransferase domain-containing protein [Nitrospiraceae bacterium]